MPFYICIGVLTAVLILREIHHNHIQKGLLNKLLELKGLEAIPEDHPLAEAVGKFVERGEQPKGPTRLRIPIPGSAVWTAMAKRQSK